MAEILPGEGQVLQSPKGLIAFTIKMMQTCIIWSILYWLDNKDAQLMIGNVLQQSLHRQTFKQPLLNTENTSKIDGLRKFPMRWVRSKVILAKSLFEPCTV